MELLTIWHYLKLAIGMGIAYVSFILWICCISYIVSNAFELKVFYRYLRDRKRKRQ